MLGIHRAAASALAALAVVAAGLAAAAPASAASAGRPEPFIDHFSQIRDIASTVPANGDLNPYGVAVVAHSQGKLR
jgi:hypothetical protein